MKDEEARRVDVNYCVRDSFIQEVEDLMRDIDPGCYRVKDGAVVRYGGEPLTNPRTLAFFAKCYSVVPTLLRGIKALEDSLRSAWIGEAGSRRELVAERQGRREDAERRSEGKTGPEHELSYLARYLIASAACPKTTFSTDPTRQDYVEQLLRRWAGGESIASVRSTVEMLEARAAEHKASTERWAAEQEAKTEDLRKRLREAIEELARGQVREELKKPVREAKKRIKSAAG